MTLVDHLDRAPDAGSFICVAAVVVGSAIGFYFAARSSRILKAPLPPTDGNRS